MLQQILRDMYVDPELLAELDEEQKQVLFCKMREEQLRRWREKEMQLEQEEKKLKKTAKTSKRRVDFKLGADGNPWVWVMGDHPNDKSIEEIIEEEVQRKAQLQALLEGEKIRKQKEEELEKKRKEEEEKALVEMKKAAETAQQVQKEEVKSIKEKVEEDKKKEEERIRNRLSQIRSRIDREKRQSIADTTEMVNRRSMEIFTYLQEQHKQKEKEAEEGVRKLTKEWEEQERKARDAEKQQQSLARQAREKHNSWRDMQLTLQTVQAFREPVDKSTDDKTVTNNSSDKTVASSSSKENKPPLPSKSIIGKEFIPPKPQIGDLKAHPIKPPSKEAIKEWFRKSEVPRGAGIDVATKQIAPWFHGLISRQDAEVLLSHSKSGTFLVRLSDRVWGYAVSYKGQDRYKHYLVDAAGPHYHFFGDNQQPFDSLASLIAAYKEIPISIDGQEKLLYACGQTLPGTPDYADLFSGLDKEISHL